MSARPGEPGLGVRAVVLCVLQVQEGFLEEFAF